MSGRLEINCSEAMCVSDFFKSKYKMLRAAFVAMSRMHNLEKKNAGKDRQRIIQLCKDGILSGPVGMPQEQFFNRILELLDAKKAPIEFNPAGLGR